MADSKKRDAKLASTNTAKSADILAAEAKLVSGYEEVVRLIGITRNNYDTLIRKPTLSDEYPRFEKWLQESIDNNDRTVLDKTTPDGFRVAWFDKNINNVKDSLLLWRALQENMFDVWTAFERMLDVAIEVYKIPTNFEQFPGGEYAHNYHESRVNALMEAGSKIGDHFSGFCNRIFMDMKAARNKSKDWEDGSKMAGNLKAIRDVMDNKHGDVFVFDTDFKQGAEKLKLAIIEEINPSTGPANKKAKGRGSEPNLKLQS